MDVRRTGQFNEWLAKLKDQQARAKIIARGPGYRVYHVQRGAEIVIVLAGGTKKTRDADIKKAKETALEL